MAERRPPLCGAARCLHRARYVDVAGVGWCATHRDRALCPTMRATGREDFCPVFRGEAEDCERRHP